MHTVLVTGPGGAGTSTAAAATAALAARRGHRTLLLATDPPGAADPPLGVRSTVHPTEVERNLFTAHVDEQQAFRDLTLAGQERLLPALELLGADPLEPEELVALPGATELVLLSTLRQEYRSGAWDLLVVDCPPTPRLLGALALPEQLRRYLIRLLPEERQIARALRPVLAAVAGAPMPAEWLFDAVQWAHTELDGLREVLDAPSTVLRLVAEPDRNAPLRFARAGAALFGHRVDAVLANRILPEGSADPWLSVAAERQHHALTRLRQECDQPEEAAVPVHPLPYLACAPSGVDDLADLAAVAYGTVPGPVPRAAERAESYSVTEPEGQGSARTLVLRMPLPGAQRHDLDLDRSGDELVITLGPYRRMLRLPSALRRCSVAGASLRDGVLQVRFRPDPGLWPVP